MRGKLRNSLSYNEVPRRSSHSPPPAARCDSASSVVLRFSRRGRVLARRPSEWPQAPPWRGCCERGSSQRHGCHGCHAAGALHVEPAGGCICAWHDAAAAWSCTPIWRRPSVSSVSASVDDLLLCCWICDLAVARCGTGYGCMEAAPRSCHSSSVRDPPFKWR